MTSTDTRPWSARAPTFIVIGITLFALTAVSYFLARMHLGSMALVVALGIAAVKATLIALFYMHLLEHRGANSLVVGAAVLLVGLLITLVVFETATRRLLR